MMKTFLPRASFASLVLAVLFLGGLEDPGNQPKTEIESLFRWGAVILFLAITASRVPNWLKERSKLEDTSGIFYTKKIPQKIER